MEFCKSEWQIELVLLLLGLVGRYPENTGESEIKKMKVLGKIQMNKINGSASGEVSWRCQWEKGVAVADPGGRWSVNTINGFVDP